MTLRYRYGVQTKTQQNIVLCSFQIIEPVAAVSLNALNFTVCYDLTKVHFNSADCLNT